MKKIDFVNGTTIDGAKTFNDMQSNVEEVFNGKEAMGSIMVDGIECTNKLDVSNPYTLTGDKDIYFAEPLPIGTYTIGFASKTTDGANNCRFILRNLSGTAVQDLIFYGDTYKTFTINEECARIQIFSQDTWANSQNKVTTFNELVLVKGDKLLPYSQYKKIGHNETESMGKIVVDDITCKNLFNSKLFSNETKNGLTLNVATDGKITITGTSTANTNFYIPYTFNSVMLNNQYTYSIIGTITGIGNIGFKLSAGADVDNSLLITPNSQKTTFTMTQNFIDNVGRFDIYINKNRTVDMSFYIQLEKGDKTTPYTPYKNFNAPYFQDLTSEIVYNSAITGTKNFALYKYGNILYLQGYISNSNITTDTTIFTIPSKYVSGTINTIAGIFIGGEGALVRASINTSGEFIAKSNTSWLNGNLTWIIKDNTTSTQSASTMSLRPDTTEEGELDG